MYPTDVSKMTIERLKYYIENSSTGLDVEAVLSNPNFNEVIFDMLLTKSIGSRGLELLLSHPFMNTERFERLYDNVHYMSYSLHLFLKSPLLTEKVYDSILKKNNSSLNSLLMNSTFASEKTCLALIKPLDVLDDVNEDTYWMIIRSPHFTSAVLEKMLGAFPKNNDMIIEIIRRNVATDEQFKKICDICSSAVYSYRDVLQYVINDSRCSQSVIVKYAKYSASDMEFALNSNALTAASLKDIVQTCNRDCVLKIIASPVVNDDILIEVLKHDYNKNSSSWEDTELLELMLSRPGIGEKVLCAILEKAYYQKTKDKVMAHPGAGVSVKVAVIIDKSSLTKEDLDSLFMVSGLTVEHLKKLMEKHPTVDVYTRIINCSLAGQELYRAVIDNVCKKKITGYKDVLKQLLNKDLDEKNLCHMIGLEKDFDLIKKVIKHPNARLEVAKKVNMVCDGMSEAQQKELIQLAADLKHKVMEEVFNIEQEENVTEILRMNVEDGMSTMLWGPSGVGKSSRVLEIDPTATLLILKNGMLPEEVIGGKEPNGEPGQIYPPHWYVVLCEKCQREPDRKHILFIDEFTNVSDTIKNLAWEIIGNRLVNGHEEWPLPENCSIVVAGNRPEESSAVRIDANGGVMPAPLHNRIDSMLEIKFDIDEWQKWALETNPKTGNLRIHPIVYSFCIAHADQVMFTNYNPDDVTQPFLTPRKWETLSNALYSAERRGANNHVSYSRILSILGDNEISRAFVAHYERLPIDMNKIVMGTYTEEDFPTVEDKLYALGIIIAQYDGDYVTIENFILECLGDEYLSVYKNMKNVKNSVTESMSDTNSTGFARS